MNRTATALATLALLTAAVVVMALDGVDPLAPDRPTPSRAPSTPTVRLLEESTGGDQTATEIAPNYTAIQRRDLAERAGTMTLADALAGLDRHAAGISPEHNRWLFQVSGFLLLHPEACGPFVEAALAADTPLAKQALAADVLVGVGHAAARRAFRQLVDETMAPPAGRHRLVQSALLLATPDAETARWLADLTDDAEIGLGAVNALGAVAGQLRAIDADAAEAALTTLEQGLQAAADDRSRRAHLMALGNAGAGAAALAFVDDADPAVRASAASALRGLATDGATAALLDLAVDSDPRVQAKAIAALAPRLDPAEAETLAAAARAGQLAPGSQSALLHAATTGDAHPAAAAVVLDTLAEVAAVPRVRERARRARLAAR